MACTGALGTASARRALAASAQWQLVRVTPHGGSRCSAWQLPCASGGAAGPTEQPESASLRRALGGLAACAAAAVLGGGPCSQHEEHGVVHKIGQGASGEEYSLLHKIGKGAYGEVYEGVGHRSGDRYAVKVLRPTKEGRLQREVQILEALRGGPNIIELVDVVREPESRGPCLVFEHVDKTSHRELYPELTDREVRHYMYQLVVAVAHCHSRGVMHRDLKPRNVVIDHKERKLRLIDFGLAEYYKPGQEYSVRVSSLYYKPPELLCGLRRYDCSLDVWSLGCMLAGLIFRREPFFHGRDDHDQLAKIARVLGTSDLFAYLDKYKLVLDVELRRSLLKTPRKPWLQFLTESNCHLVSEEAVDLVKRMLVYDHAHRITLKEALEHPYFDPVRPRHSSGYVVATFQPGALGITAHPGGVVTRVEGEGQGALHGVVAGWHFDSVDLQGFSVQLLRERAAGERPYTVTFRLPAEAGVE